MKHYHRPRPSTCSTGALRWVSRGFQHQAWTVDSALATLIAHGLNKLRPDSRESLSFKLQTQLSFSLFPGPHALTDRSIATRSFRVGTYPHPTAPESSSCSHTIIHGDIRDKYNEMYAVGASDSALTSQEPVVI
jgi:hypothetical protein